LPKISTSRAGCNAYFLLVSQLLDEEEFFKESAFYHAVSLLNSNDCLIECVVGWV